MLNLQMDLPLFTFCKMRLLILLQIISYFSLSFSLNIGNETDMLSLLAFKGQITDDPLGVLSSWNESSPFCQWSGVSCGRRHQRVVKLRLNSSKLHGSLSPHVGNLSFVRTLDLGDNNFRGDIPQELGRLFRLQILRLQNNTFSGVIPANISRCSNLRVLLLETNKLTGKLPVELGMLSKLEFLVFQYNDLVGEMPSSFGNLSSISKIYGTQNNLQGGIPPTIGGELKRLSAFSLDSNKLTGTIPPSLYNLSSLTTLALGENQLHGNLPPYLFQTLPILEFLNVGDNQFIGQIPVSLSNASHLTVLEFGGNQLTGKVPIMPNLHNLRFLSLFKNDLGKVEDDDLTFLNSLANNTNKLEILGIDDNNLGGVLPNSLTNFSTNLRQMIFGRNHIRGSIPVEIGNFINLEVLALEKNQLTGTIPNSIGNLKNLGPLIMNNNKISGIIPASLGNLTSLLSLDLSQNQLQGRIPSALGNCQKLLDLILRDNKLSGAIPEEIFHLSSLSLNLDLSRNQLTGSLPLLVSKLVQLGQLDISHNKLSGEIPSSLASCVSLEVLYLGGNFFQGAIPQSLSALKAIRYLNFSHNNLTGQIPKFLGEFKLLVNLDLSFNGFEGEVPVKGVFTNVSQVSILGNKDLCGGVPLLNLHKCSLNNDSEKPESASKKLLVIAIVCGCLGVIFMVCFLLFYCIKRAKNNLLHRSSSGNSLLRVTYEDLRQATDGFSSSNLIGAGSFGSVYYGILNSIDGNVVAVKVLNLKRKGALKSFMAECKVLTNIRHRNLVKVLTACSSIDCQGNDFKALVYEYMVNGSLDEWLDPVSTSSDHQTHDEPKMLNLVQRLNIAVDVASALDYLHHHCHAQIVHCDLKPSNVLLDEDMTAHVGDFGISRFLQEVSNQSSSNYSSSIGVNGTIGYAAPEYGTGSAVSTHGDVYSFGILLLEMFTGKKPTDSMFKDGLSLHNFSKAALPSCALDVADPYLVKEHEQMTVTALRMTRYEPYTYLECLISVLKVGVACSAELPRDRMDINSAEAELNRIRDTLSRRRVSGHLDQET